MEKKKYKVYVKLTYASLIEAESLQKAHDTALMDGISVESFVHGNGYDYSYVGMDIDQIEEIDR